MGDGSLAAAVWDGAIPLCLSLDEHEVAAPQAPPSLFTLVPRHAYLPMLSDAAFAHFRDVLPPGDNELWFDAAGVPLKWQLPCGVLHDLLGGELPWRLRVHFRAYPEGTLTRCSGPEAVRGHLFNSLKEACYLASGSASAVLTLHSTAQTDVWQGLLDRDFARYKRGAAALSASSRSSRRISIRLHVRAASSAGTPSGLRDVTSSSHASPADDTSTLRELLDGLLPEHWLQSTRIRVQGVEAPLDAPLRVLNAYLCGPDGFIHVCALQSDTDDA